MVTLTEVSSKSSYSRRTSTFSSHHRITARCHEITRRGSYVAFSSSVLCSVIMTSPVWVIDSVGVEPTKIQCLKLPRMPFRHESESTADRNRTCFSEAYNTTTITLPLPSRCHQEDSNLNARRLMKPCGYPERGDLVRQTGFEPVFTGLEPCCPATRPLTRVNLPSKC